MTTIDVVTPVDTSVPTGLGAPVARLEGRDKVTGAARYSYEHTPEGVLYGWIVQSSVTTGTITGSNRDEVLAMPGVRDVITHEQAPHLEDAEDGELLVLQSADVAYRGQPVALVVADTFDTAREAASALAFDYDEGRGDVVLSTDHPSLYAPETVNAGFETDTSQGDVDAAMADSAVTIDETYETAALFNSPMEPHATVATWADGELDVLDSNQGTSGVATTLATLFSLDPSAVRVRAEHVGGGFGSKGSARPVVVLASIGAMLTGRPVKVAYTRQMMFAIAGYRTPTISRVRLAADSEGHLSALSHEAYSHSSTLQEFTEQTAEPTRHLWAAPSRLMTHRLARLDVPTPRWMRAPGEAPGIYAVESAMDELASKLDVDPVELRIRNEPEVDPHTGQPFSSRHLVDCLRRGAELFGWAGRDPRQGVRRVGRWLVGTGVAAATYPASVMPAGARVTALPGGRFEVGVNATDIGQGARTVMAQIAAAELGVPVDLVDLHIADSRLPTAGVAGGSSGTASWGWAVTKASRQVTELLSQGQPVPLDSGEVVVPRMVGVFAAGRIMNARTARSQFVGGMTMGLSMALHEHGMLDPTQGDYGNHDFATYHVASNADVGSIEVEWLDEQDPHLAPMGGKGIGEIGNVGAAAAVANAVAHATGIRVRDLPIQPDKLLAGLPTRY